MANRTLNQVVLMGNITHKLESRTTPSGAMLVPFTVATNRAWTTEGGESKEETEFHKVVSWGKLAEIIVGIAEKGSKVYIKGRLHYKDTEENGKRTTHYEIVAEDFILL